MTKKTKGPLTDAQVQRMLNQLVRICNELDDEAKRRYGSKGNLFFESEGSFHLMDGDADGRIRGLENRQKHIQFSSDGYCQLGAGAW